MPMTEKQQAIYDWVRDYIWRQGISPTLDEIADRFAVAKPTIHQHIESLVQKGLIIKQPKLARSLTLPDTCPTCGAQMTQPPAGPEEITDNGE